MVPPEETHGTTVVPLSSHTFQHFVTHVADTDLTSINKPGMKQGKIRPIRNEFRAQYNKLLILIGFEVLTALSAKIAVFWVVAPCSLVEVC
jgi:hypothetical protein